MTALTLWQDPIKRVHATVGVRHVDLLFDQSAWHTDLIGALEQIRPVVLWFSLFTGTPEENLREQAPEFMCLGLRSWQHKAWLEALVTHCAPNTCLLFVISPLSFETLSPEQRFCLLYSFVLQAMRENYFGDLNEYVRSAL